MTGIEKAQEANRLRRESGETIERLNPVEKSKQNPKSLRLAINGKCWDCSGGQRMEIKNCDIKSCTLWLVRPYQEKEMDNDHK